MCSFSEKAEHLENPASHTIIRGDNKIIPNIPIISF